MNFAARKVNSNHNDNWQVDSSALEVSKHFIKNDYIRSPVNLLHIFRIPF